MGRSIMALSLWRCGFLVVDGGEWAYNASNWLRNKQSIMGDINFRIIFSCFIFNGFVGLYGFYVRFIA